MKAVGNRIAALASSLDRACTRLRLPLGMASALLLAALIALLIAGLVGWLLAKPDAPGLFRAGLWLIAGGGLGNLYDRIAYGFVVDFIRTDFIDFPVFNVADCYVVVCGVLFCIVAVFQKNLLDDIALQLSRKGSESDGAEL